MTLVSTRLGNWVLNLVRVLKLFKMAIKSGTLKGLGKCYGGF